MLIKIICIKVTPVKVSEMNDLIQANTTHFEICLWTNP